MEKISARILKFNKDRLPEMLDLKYKSMSENIFRFYRGTNHIFYEDLTHDKDFPASPSTWICGDLHLENFGSFKSSNRQLYFDLNDFDEAVMAPVLWEIVRMVTSIFTAFEGLKIGGDKALHMARLFLKSYSERLAMGKPDYIEPQTSPGIICDFLTAMSKKKQKDLLDKKTKGKKSNLEILLSDPGHFKLKKNFRQELTAHVTGWLKNDSMSPYNYKVLDAVFHVAGTGSVGLKRFAILLKSLNENGERFMMVDMKESIDSSLTPYVTSPQPGWDSEAQRIVTIQQQMQNRSPALLSTSVFHHQPYVMEEIQPTKDRIDFKLLKKQYRKMVRVIDDMGMLTASAHLRSRGHIGSATADELMSLGRSTDWQEPVLAYGIKYSQQVKLDYIGFLKDYKKRVFKTKKTDDPKIVK